MMNRAVNGWEKRTAVYVQMKRTPHKRPDPSTTWRIRCFYQDWSNKRFSGTQRPYAFNRVGLFPQTNYSTLTTRCQTQTIRWPSQTEHGGVMSVGPGCGRQFSSQIPETNCLIARSGGQAPEQIMNKHEQNGYPDNFKSKQLRFEEPGYECDLDSGRRLAILHFSYRTWPVQTVCCSMLPWGSESFLLLLPHCYGSQRLYGTSYARSFLTGLLGTTVFQADEIQITERFS